MKKRLLLMFILIPISCIQENIIAQPMEDSIKVESHSLTEVEKNLRDNSVWYFQFGYFPRTEDFYSGLSYILGKEFQVAKYLNLGWRLQIGTAFEELQNFSGFGALYMTFDNDFKLGNQLLFLKCGVGFTAVTGIGTGGFLEIEYVVYQFNGFALSITTSQTFYQFKYIGPTIFSIGILF